MTTRSLVSPESQTVTFVELFFDLVFVFSVTQIVGLLHDGITLTAVGQGVLLFWLVWWGWTQFTWTLNAANTDHPRIQGLVLLATAVAFFMAVAVPAAFEGGALWFALPYVLLRLIGLGVHAWVSSENPAQNEAVRSFALVSLGGLLAVLMGAALGGSLLPLFWGLAILLDIVAATLGGAREGWDLHPEHFVERHGLIVIIALGESLIVAAGGLAAAPQSAAPIVVAILAVGVTCALWWSYFPALLPALEQGIEQLSGAPLAEAARDIFSLAHFPMLCGIIAVAAAVEEAIVHPTEALPTGARMALAGGLFLFLVGGSLARWRADGDLPVARLALATGTALVLLLLPALAPATALAVGLGGTLATALTTRRPTPHPQPHQG